MGNLLQANLFRLFRSLVFWGAMLVIVGGAVAICIGAYHDMVLYNEPGYMDPLDKTLFRAEQALGITSKANHGKIARSRGVRPLAGFGAAPQGLAVGGDLCRRRPPRITH